MLANWSKLWLRWLAAAAVASPPWLRLAERTSARSERLCRLSLAWWLSILAEGLLWGWLIMSRVAQSHCDGGRTYADTNSG